MKKRLWVCPMPMQISRDFRDFYLKKGREMPCFEQINAGYLEHRTPSSRDAGAKMTPIQGTSLVDISVVVFVHKRFRVLCSLVLVFHNKKFLMPRQTNNVLSTALRKSMPIIFSRTKDSKYPCLTCISTTHVI